MVSVITEKCSVREILLKTCLVIFMVTILTVRYRQMQYTKLLCASKWPDHFNQDFYLLSDNSSKETEN